MGLPPLFESVLTPFSDTRVVHWCGECCFSAAYPSERAQQLVLQLQELVLKASTLTALVASTVSEFEHSSM
jgi:hypothetical protein